ncbi:MAG: transcriptional activator NhaR [Candidatus Wallbacteria bacterium]|nr:transcriptional activator NhaR [Candidatus Wallbacteria bacterium]
MGWLNYHHLLYFWTVAREGSVVAAGKKLRLSHSTLAIQIRQLENRFKEKLFERSGRNLRLTRTGRTVLVYADQIFGLGNELLEVMCGRPGDEPVRLVVGIADVMPKTLVSKLLLPVGKLVPSISLLCREGSPAGLAEMLLHHDLDAILSDAPISGEGFRRVFSHLLGQCGVSFFASRALAQTYGGDFPASLHDAPMLLPCAGTTLRSALERWFHAKGIRPRIVAEFEDSALMKALGQDSLGVFASPSAVEDAVSRQYDVSILGRADEIQEHFYAISLERRITHPGIAAICSSARTDLFLKHGPQGRSNK